MLIALLIYLLFGSDGPEAVFTIPDLEDRIVATIPDVKRQTEVLGILQRANADIGTARKRLTAQGASLMREQGERIVTSGELRTSFERLFLIRQELQFGLVDRDAEMREALTDEEFRSIVVDGLANLARDKEDPAQDPGEKLDRELTGIREVIERNIEDPEKRNAGLKAFEAFDTYMSTLVVQDTAHTHMVDVYSKREVPRMVLEDTFSDMDRFRVDMFDHFIEMRETLVEVTTEDEWRPIANKLNVFFK